MSVGSRAHRRRFARVRSIAHVRDFPRRVSGDAGQRLAPGQGAADMHCGKAENMPVRLDDPRSRIEFERTKELVLRDLAPPQRWTGDRSSRPGQQVRNPQASCSPPRPSASWPRCRLGWPPAEKAARPPALPPAPVPPPRAVVGGRGGMGRMRVRAAGSIRQAASPPGAGASKTSDHALPTAGPAHAACAAAAARSRTCPSRIA